MTTPYFEKSLDLSKQKNDFEMYSLDMHFSESNKKTK